MNLNINKGFENMIPKETIKKREVLFKNEIRFKIFKRRISFSIEIT